MPVLIVFCWGLGIVGLCGCWFLYNYFIGFSDRDMSSAHNMIVANFIAIAYCVVGLYIDAKIHGFSHPFKMFNRWIKKDAEDDLQPVVDDYYLKNRGWILALYFSCICMLGNAVVSFFRLVHFFATTPL